MPEIKTLSLGETHSIVYLTPGGKEAIRLKVSVGCDGQSAEIEILPDDDQVLEVALDRGSMQHVIWATTGERFFIKVARLPR